MAKNFLESLAGIDLGSGLSGSNSLDALTDLANTETSDEKQAARLEGLSDQLQMNSPFTAVLKGVTGGVADRKRTKAEKERDARLQDIALQTQHAQQMQDWSKGVEQKLQQYQLAEAERLASQTAIDEGLRLAVDHGDGQALSEVVKANPNMQNVLDDTLPDGVRFEGVNFDRANGTLVPFGRDQDGNTHYGMGQKWERFASPQFMEQRAAGLVQARHDEADLAKTEAETRAADALAGQRGRDGQGAAPKPIPPSSLKVQNEALNAIGQLQGLNADIDALVSQIDAGQLQTDPLRRGLAAVRTSVGMSKEKDRNLSALDSKLSSLRNGILLLNKGVQTEGDAQRAMDEIVKNPNDTALMRQRLMDLKALNQRGADLQKLQVDNIRANYGHEPMDYAQYENQPSAVTTQSRLEGNAEAENIRARFRAGELTREQAKAALQQLGSH